MSPAKYDKVLSPGRSGVYLAPAGVRALRAAVTEAKLAWFELDATSACDKQRFLAACAKNLGFPEWFGANWDALADCLKDFSWRRAPGYLILWRDAAALAAAAPDDFATALEIFSDAASYCKTRGGTFIVLLDEEPAGIKLPRFPGP